MPVVPEPRKPRGRLVCVFCGGEKGKNDTCPGCQSRRWKWENDNDDGED